MAEATLYSTQNPTNPNESDGETSRALATTWYADVAGSIVGIRWRSPTGAFPSAVEAQMWSLSGDDPTTNTGTRLITEAMDFTGYTPGDWVEYRFSAPLSYPTANKPRVAQVYITGGRYTFSSPGDFPFDNGNLHAYSAANSNGRWTNSPASNNVLAANNHPGGSGYDFFVDVIFSTGSTVSGVAAIAPGGVTVAGVAKRLVDGVAALNLGGVTVLGAGDRTVHGSAAVSPGGVTVAADNVVAASSSNGWYGLIAIDRERAMEYARSHSTPPVACPNDGEPLRHGKNGTRRCPFDGWTWPTDGPGIR